MIPSALRDEATFDAGRADGLFKAAELVRQCGFLNISRYTAEGLQTMGEAYATRAKQRVIKRMQGATP